MRLFENKTFVLDYVFKKKLTVKRTFNVLKTVITAKNFKLYCIKNSQNKWFKFVCCNNMRW